MRLDHITPKRFRPRVLRKRRKRHTRVINFTDYRLQIQSSSGPPLEDITGLLGNHSVLDPPDPIPNSEVKRYSADDSVGSPHVKVGHCQAFIPKPSVVSTLGFFNARDHLLGNPSRNGNRPCGSAGRPIGTARETRMPAARWSVKGNWPLPVPAAEAVLSIAA